MSPGGAQGNGEHLIFYVVRFVDEALELALQYVRRTSRAKGCSLVLKG